MRQQLLLLKKEEEEEEEGKEEVGSGLPTLGLTMQACTHLLSLIPIHVRQCTRQLIEARLMKGLRTPEPCHGGPERSGRSG